MAEGAITSPAEPHFPAAVVGYGAERGITVEIGSQNIPHLGKVGAIEKIQGLDGEIEPQRVV
ncbi:MAG: hypothetical protein ACREAM_10545, partial [Blastocatellia bacterium]